MKKKKANREKQANDPEKKRGHKTELTLSQLGMAVLIIVMGLLLAVFFKVAYSISILNTLSFFTAALFFLILPGKFLGRILGLNGNTWPVWVVSAITGMAFSPILYVLVRFAGAAKVFPVFMVSVSLVELYYIFIRNKNVEGHEGRRISLNKNTFYLALIIAAILILLDFSHFSDIKLQADGSFYLRDHYMTETIFHVGYIETFNYSLTPDAIYLSGSPLNYHFNMHILGHLLCRFTGIDVIIMSYYFLPLLFFTLIVFTAAAFFYSRGNSVVVAIFFGIAVFGGDFSFFPGLLYNPLNIQPWSAIFKSTFEGLFTINGVIPSLAFCWAVFYILSEYIKNKDRRLIILLILLVYSAFGYKSSMGLQLWACIALLSLVCYIGKRERHYALIVLAMVLSGSFIFIDLAIKSSFAGSGIRLSLDLFNGIAGTAKSLDLLNVLRVINFPISLPLAFLFFYILYLIFTFGFRSAFFFDVISFFRNRRRFDFIEWFLLLFILSGFMLSEIIILTGEDFTFNNAGWFAFPSIIVAGYFPFTMLDGVKSNVKKAVFTGFMFLLMVPSLVNFLFLRNDDSYIHINISKIEAADFIKKNIEAKAVFIELFENDTISIASQLAGKSTVISIFRTFNMDPDKIEEQKVDARIADTYRFFYYDDEARRKIASKYSITHALVPKKFGINLSKSSIVRNIFENKDYVIYQIAQN